MSNLERGEHRVYLDHAYNAAAALGVSVTDLLPPFTEMISASTIKTASDDPISQDDERKLVDVIRQIGDKDE